MCWHAFLFLFLGFPVLAYAQFRFADPVTIPTDDEPFYLVADDFNRDGHIDIAVCNRRASSASLFLGDGKGGFSSRADFPLEERVHETGAVAGPNHDGALSPTGAGHEGEGLRSTGMTTADLNGDGALDLIVANSMTATVSILYGDGRGGFADAVEFPAGGPTPSAVVAADFNRDGRLDVAVANRAAHTVHTGDVTILQQGGAGGFTVRENHLQARSPRHLLAADLTGDGIPDLVSANFLAANVHVFVGKGDGTFHDPIVLESAPGPVHIVAADLNGDDALDLVIANRRAGAGQPGVSVYLGTWGGRFRDPAYLPAGELPAAVAAADFNGDGFCDVAVVNGFTDDLMLYPGDGRGGFGDSATIPFPTYPFGVTPRSIVAADLDHDGDMDLVIANKDNNTLTVLLNDVARPVGVAVTSATARPLVSGGVEISWETTASGAVVFIYRQPGSAHEGQASPDEWTRITDAPFTGPGRHRFIDDGARTGQTYTYWLEAIEPDGSRQVFGPLIVTVDPPAQFALAQNAPNPFNAGTTITYHLARPCRATLTVYNILGKEVAPLVDADQAPGVYTVRWDGRNDRGEPVGSGVYLYTLRAGAFTATRRMALVK